MDSAQREILARRVLEFSNAQQTEVMVETSQSALTRFTHNAVHQNVAVADTGIKVRAIEDGRTGVATTNQDSEEALRDVVRRAIAMARLAPADPQQPALPERASFPASPNAFIDGTARASAQERAHMCEAVFRTAEEHGYWCAGYATTASQGVTIANGNGVCASYDTTDAGINVKMNAPDSTGYAEWYGNDCTKLDAQAVAKTAAAKANGSAHPRDVEPGEWTVILEPPAFGELFQYLAGHFSAQSFDEGSSFLSDALGTMVFDERLSVSDDPGNPLNPGMPFDYEGAPTQRVSLVEAGIAKNVVTDSYYAHKLQRANTGHALPAPNSYGPQPLHVVVAPGAKSVEQLIAQTQRGLLVTRFWYIRTVDQKQAIVTGMTRDGTFLIENGELRGGVRNMRFNQSIVQALSSCELANELRRTGGYSYSMVCPAVKIDRFRFSSGTAF